MPDETPRPMTIQEMRGQFLRQVRATLDYWASADLSQPEFSAELAARGEVGYRMEGLVFSIMTILDGATDVPALDLTPAPHQDDQEFHRGQGENWWTRQVINDCQLHEAWSLENSRASRGAGASRIVEGDGNKPTVPRVSIGMTNPSAGRGRGLLPMTTDESNGLLISGRPALPPVRVGETVTIESTVLDGPVRFLHLTIGSHPGLQVMTPSGLAPHRGEPGPTRPFWRIDQISIDQEAKIPPGIHVVAPHDWYDWGIGSTVSMRVTNIGDAPSHFHATWETEGAQDVA